MVTARYSNQQDSNRDKIVAVTRSNDPATWETYRRRADVFGTKYE